MVEQDLSKCINTPIISFQSASSHLQSNFLLPRLPPLSISTHYQFCAGSHYVQHSVLALPLSLITYSTLYSFRTVSILPVGSFGLNLQNDLLPLDQICSSKCRQHHHFQTPYAIYLICFFKMNCTRFSSLRLKCILGCRSCVCLVSPLLFFSLLVCHLAATQFDNFVVSYLCVHLMIPDHDSERRLTLSALLDWWS
jgi:hypothetical protein